MACFVCAACGVQFADSGDRPPARCPVCEDERQFLPPGGQSWTILDDLRQERRNAFERHETGLYGIATTPEFAIGQRALLVRAAVGNVLWDCITLLDDATIDIVTALGGVDSIAISHPHFYSAMVEWSRVFDAPIHLHEADREWVMRPDPAIRFWGGDRLELDEGPTLIRCGGHFEGSAVLHWSEGAEGRGALMTGDTVAIAEDTGWVSFMRSYPNRIPLPAATVRAIGERLEPLSYDRLYGGFRGKRIAHGAKDAVRRSVDRYLKALEG